MGLPDISEHIRKGRRYYIYGTKTLGKYCFHIITGQFGSGAVIGFIETRPDGEVCCHKRIYALHELKEPETDTDIIVASPNYYKEIRDNLIHEGIADEKIIILGRIYPYFKSTKFIKGRKIKKVCFWPPVKKCDTDVQKKIAWFLPDKTEVTVWCEKDMENDFGGNVSVGDQKEPEKEFDGSDIIFVWHMADCSEVAGRYLHKMYIVDPDFWFYVETINYSDIYYHLHNDTEKNEILEESKELFHKLSAGCRRKRANVFCSGPSINEIYDADFANDLNIITNSMVRDRKLLERLRPELLVYSDINFYISPHAYCEEFYKDVLDAVKKYDMKIVVFDHYKPLIQYHIPELKGKIIGIPCVSDDFVFPDGGRFLVKSTGNILTELLLPVASALCDEIGIAGCTGRHPDETYYWKHSPDTQYLDLMQSVFDMYPSVFRDQEYDDYYDRHCKIVEKILTYGEQQGKTYKNLTTSYIPALRERSVMKPERSGGEIL